MSWQQMEQCWMAEKWRRPGPARFSKEERRCSRVLQYAVSFHCLVKERHGCEDITAQPKDKRILVDKEGEAMIHLNGEVCSQMQIPLHEMREEQQ